MCGIVGYVGDKQNGIDVVLDGLETLEYRGYDSAGIAFLDTKGKPQVIKKVGPVKNLRKKELPEANINLAIGHTRWATHGLPNTKNAHPHFNTDKTIFVVHNGIIENATELRAMLTSNGYSFVSQTDTEVVPHLIDFYIKEKHHTFAKAFELALRDLRGAFAIAAITTHEPHTLFAARVSSPLVIGVGKGEYSVASDPSAIPASISQVIYLEDHEMAVIKADGYTIQNIKESKTVEHDVEDIAVDTASSERGNFEHFMLKEMHEVPDAIRSALKGRLNVAANTVKLGGLEAVSDRLQTIERIIIVACGTSYYAGLVGEYLIEQLAGIPVEVQLASEFKYRDEPLTQRTAVLAISQSGETADTIAALKKVEPFGILRLGIVNAVGSTIARLTDAGVYCHAGPEQAVASTKAFVSQVTVLTLMALDIAKHTTTHYAPTIKGLATLPEKAEEVISTIDKIRDVAQKYVQATDFLYIGRGMLYPCALEGALKLKEISYIHAEGYAAGEMKHGPLAMIDENFPTFAIATDTSLLEKTYSNIEEIKARKGKVIAIATEGNVHIAKLADDVLYIPVASEQVQPQLVALVMQLFSYFVATEKGYNVDRPRNLAKSVTVE